MATRSATYREISEGFEYTIDEIIARVTNKDEQARKAAAFKRRYMLNDRFRDVVDNELRNLFVDASYQVMRKYIDVSTNLYRRVMKEISLVYQREPERTLEPEGAMQRYGEITQEVHLDLALARANFLMNGLNDLIIHPCVLGDGLGISILTPDQVTVFLNTDDPTIVEALAIEEKEVDKNGKARSSYTFWSPTRHFILREDPNNEGSFIKLSMNENDENPYKEQNLKEQKFHPFVFGHASYRDYSFWDCDTNNSLYEATILVALQNTFKNFMIPQQFKQLAVKVTSKGEGGWINEQLSNPLHIFQTNGDMVVLDWQSAIDKLDIVIQNKMAQVANDYGISAEQMKLQISAQSGFSRLVAKERVYELRDEQIKFWRIIEAELYDAFRAANNLYLTTDFETQQPTNLSELPEDAKFSVDFAEPKVLVDPKEDLEVKQTKIEMGVISPVDIIMAENPDIDTREKALKKFQENIADRDLIEKTLGGNFRTPTLKDQQSGKAPGQSA